ncbi:shikimate dehydrogenase family protein [Homoserinimonas sp. A447]
MSIQTGFSGTPRQLAVLGSPITHSLSPRLQSAAYDTLGLPWEYQAIELTGDRLAEFLDTRDQQWRGVSLTMPLKREVIPLLDTLDEVAELTGVVNTVLLDGGTRRGFNTDVAGMTRAFTASGVNRLDNVVILGGGATAASALVAAARLGAASARFWLRTPSKATALEHLAAELDMDVQLWSFSDVTADVGHPDAVVSTIPNGAVVNVMFPEDVRRGSVLFDVAYDPWPTTLAQTWTSVSAPVISGAELLIEQALVQVRIFVTGDPETELPDEQKVLGAMRASMWPLAQD